MKSNIREIREIPKTDSSSYISGWYALNTPHPNYLSADWHSDIWYKKKNSNFDTIPLYSNKNILKELGIEKREIIWSDKEEYIASYPRAIADLFLEKNGVWINELYGARDEFLNNDLQLSEELYNYLLKIYETTEIEDIKKYLKWEFYDFYLKKEK